MSTSDHLNVDTAPALVDCRELAATVRALAAELRERPVSVRMHHTVAGGHPLRPARTGTYADARLWV